MYAGTFRIYRTYWDAYGGARALWRSLYVHAALLLLVAMTPTWLEPTAVAAGQWSAWWDQAIAVLPTLLGFTLGGFAIFIGFGDEKFRQLLSAAGSGESLPKNAYVQLCATFVHFIVVQILALIAALLCKSWWFYTPLMDPVRHLMPWANALAGALGYGLFLYALTSVLAATMHVFRIATLYAKFQAKNNVTGLERKCPSRPNTSPTSAAAPSPPT